MKENALKVPNHEKIVKIEKCAGADSAQRQNFCLVGGA